MLAEEGQGELGAGEPVVALVSATTPTWLSGSTNSVAWKPGIEPVWPESTPAAYGSRRTPSP